MSKWVEFESSGRKVLVDAEKVQYVEEQFEGKCELAFGRAGNLEVDASFRTVKGRLIKSNGEDS